MGGGEDAIDKHCVQREVLAQLIFIQGEIALAHLGFPVRPVSGAEAFAIKLCFFGQNLVLAGRIGINGRHQTAQHVTYCRCFLGGFFSDDVIRVGVIAQQLGALCAQLRHLHQHCGIGLRAA